MPDGFSCLLVCVSVVADKQDCDWQTTRVGTAWCVLAEFTVQVLPGDSVVVATDGLLDNIFLSEVAAAAAQLRRQGSNCSDVAMKLADFAHSKKNIWSAFLPVSKVCCLLCLPD